MKKQKNFSGMLKRGVKMKMEDYNKYYIQGSDHYLIPKDVFIELFSEMENWKEESQKKKEVIDRIYNETKETRNILNNNRDDNMLSKSCLLSYLEIVEDLLKEVSE